MIAALTETRRCTRAIQADAMIIEIRHYTLHPGRREAFIDFFERKNRAALRDAGIEPDFSLVKFKKLVGGGSMQIVNLTIPRALKKLGYAQETVEAIVEYIADKGHVVDAPGLKPEHYEIFDTAMGQRAISPMGHVRMMAAVQPFLSGAISKTVNLPETATVEEIEDVYVQGWKMGLKALAVYRDNCKVGQPLSDGGSKAKDDKAEAEAKAEAEKVVEKVVYRPTRERLPKRRDSRTTSFAIGGAEGYLTAGTYDDGRLGEVFLKFGKQGSTLAGVMDAFSIAVSVALQYGVPLETYVEKFTNMRFEPAGMTDDPDVRMAQSIMDYVFRRLALDYLDFDTRSFMGIHTAEERARHLETGSYEPIADGAGRRVGMLYVGFLERPFRLARWAMMAAVLGAFLIAAALLHRLPPGRSSAAAAMPGAWSCRMPAMRCNGAAGTAKPIALSTTRLRRWLAACAKPARLTGSRIPMGTTTG